MNETLSNNRGLALLLAFVAGCADQGGSFDRVIFRNGFLAESMIGSKVGPVFMIDVGAVTVHLPKAFPLPPEDRLAGDSGEISSLVTLGHDFTDVHYFGTADSRMLLNGQERHLGLLGSGPFKDHTVLFDAAKPDVEVDPQLDQVASLVPLSVAAFVEHFGGIQILLHVEVEGTSRVMLLDSGAQLVTLRTEDFNVLAMSGRKIVTRAETSARATRVHTLKVGRLSFERAVVGASSSSDRLLDELSSELQVRVDGLIGMSVLACTRFVIDYPNRTVALEKLESCSHYYDPLVTVGFDAVPSQLVAEPNNFTLGPGPLQIVSIIPGSAADRAGLSIGDSVVSIEGEDPALTWFSLELASFTGGTEGERRTFTVQCGTCAAARTMVLTIEDIVPLN